MIVGNDLNMRFNVGVEDGGMRPLYENKHYSPSQSRSSVGVMFGMITATGKGYTRWLNSFNLIFVLYITIDVVHTARMMMIVSTRSICC